MMEPVIVCVVETGMPSTDEKRIDVAAAVSALNPCTGLSLVILIPKVSITRQPPVSVPMAIAKRQMRITQ